MPAPLQVIGLGAATPLGRNVLATAAAVRAGLSGFREHPFVKDSVGEPIRIARAPWLETHVVGSQRLCELLFVALDDALNVLGQKLKAHSARIGLLLALPPPRPGRDSSLVQDIGAAIAQRYPNIYCYGKSFEAGHAAGHIALEAANRACAEGSVDVCVVAGVDSYLAEDTLKWLEECDQVHSAGPLNNAWGFIPGEAAGAVVLTSQANCQKWSVASLGEIAGLGIAQETNLIKTESVCIGTGLTTAFRAAIQEFGSNDIIDNVICDMNGEKYRADEYGFAALRTKNHFRSASDFVAPADCWGDVGAAGVPLHMALAVIAQRKRYSKGPLSLISASSESGERGAAIIRAAEQGAL